MGVFIGSLLLSVDFKIKTKQIKVVFVQEQQEKFLGVSVLMGTPELQILFSAASPIPAPKAPFLLCSA